MKKKVLYAFGTRPETIKLAPLILRMRSSSEFCPVVCVSGQHREMLDQAIVAFGIKPDHDLRVMRKEQSLAGLTTRVLGAMDRVIEQERPDLVVVQGDTTTALAAALAGFYCKVPVAHVEAGLRSHDFQHPFPEELNRVLIDRFATFCFAPTELNRQILLAERVAPERIHVTGNTGIDALRMLSNRPVVRRAARDKADSQISSATRQGKVILITLHRRESFGARLSGLLTVIRKIAQRRLDWTFVYPVHMNPNVQRSASAILAGLSNVHLLTPLPYEVFVRLMRDADLILTDSGGIQEEAPSLGKHVVVLRKCTERVEAVESGSITVAGDSGRDLEAIIERGMRQGSSNSTPGKNPYGDGRASIRILRILQAHFGYNNRKIRRLNRPATRPKSTVRQSRSLD
jgi:UDP-N-acetylglucosamine 2-epimerase (non-hydrolysing)